MNALKTKDKLYLFSGRVPKIKWKGSNLRHEKMLQGKQYRSTNFTVEKKPQMGNIYSINR